MIRKSTTGDRERLAGIISRSFKERFCGCPESSSSRFGRPEAAALWRGGPRSVAAGIGSSTAARTRLHAIFFSKPLKTLLAVVSVLAGTFVFLNPAFSADRFRPDPDIVGRIVDYDTGEPISGVVVMALWTTDLFRLTIESRTEYYDYLETLSDRNGEFKIPGKGFNPFRSLNPPKIKILKTGYAVLHLEDLGPHFRRDSPYRDQVTWIDGKPVIRFRKRSVEERKNSIRQQRGIPFHEMAVPGLSEEKYRLYMEEVTRACHALGITPYWEVDHRYIRVKEGGVYPAQDVAVEPKRGE